MLTKGEINGHKAIWLENDLMKVSLLPEKGADIYELILKPVGVDFLMKTPSGLRPPGDRPPADFLENYEGAWQELFPNPNDAVVVDDVELPFHGEAALLAWQVVEETDRPDETAVKVSVDCKLLPYRVERRMRLLPDKAELEVEGTVTNLGDKPGSFQWGHHIVLGGGFLQAGCRVEAPPCMFHTSPLLYEPETAILAPDQHGAWPSSAGRQPEKMIDLREIPGPEAHTHDDLFLTDFEAGWLEVTNPAKKLRFRLEWDLDVFGCIVNWRPLGGSDKPPLTGIYGLGVEPWVSRFNLADAIRLGEALTLPPGESLRTRLKIILSMI